MIRIKERVIKVNSYPEATIFRSEARSVVSRVVGQEFYIPVWLPRSYAESDRTYPVLYLLDANVGFGTAADAVIHLTLGAEMPEIIVVGIGYLSIAELRKFRGRDLHPTPLENYPGTGGAGNFLTFIKTELIPFIETNYRADPSDRAIHGYSSGGLFVLYALFTQPKLFRRYSAGSPSVEDQPGFFDFKFEAEYASQNRSLPATLFIATGSLDNDTPAIKKADAILRARNYAGLRYEFLLMDGETHHSGAAPALVRGMKAIFTSDPAT